LATVATASPGWMACSPKPPPKAPAAPPPKPLDLRLLPEGQPEIEALMALPGLWQRERGRTKFAVVVDGEPAGAGNFDGLVGPLALDVKRNPFLVVQDTAQGRRLTERRASPALRKIMDEADQAFSTGKVDEALAGYRKVIEYDPLFPKPYFYVAAALKHRRDFEGADAWIERGLRLHERDPFGYALRAEMLEEQGKDTVARETLARAFALDPYSPPALRVKAKMARLAGQRDVRPGVQPHIFVARSGPSELVARAAGHPVWREYAVCRALLAFDTRVRAEFLQVIPQGVLSPIEETTCGFMVTAAYLHARERGAGEDLDLERWSKAFDAGLLREAVIYDVLGCRRPEILALLPDDVQVKMVEYARIFIVPAAARRSGPP